MDWGEIEEELDVLTLLPRLRHLWFRQNGLTIGNKRPPRVPRDIHDEVENDSDDLNRQASVKGEKTKCSHQY